MSIQNERLAILSEAEQAALYEIPDFDDVQRLNYLNLTPEEQALARSRANLAAQVHCAIQIGYFKAKHMFFSFDWDEVDVQDDIGFVMQEKKIMQPGYSTLQVIVRTALNAERNRLRAILHESLTEKDKASLKKLIFEKETETLSGLADLKQDTKDFKARMISAERDKMLEIKPLYRLAQSLLPKLNLSHQNVQYYASLADYYTTYDLRKGLKSEQTYLYLLCYIQQRYLHLNDNLMDAFFIPLKQFEGGLKEKAQEAYSEYAINKQSELSVMKELARLFVTPELSNEVNFGEVRKAAFAIIPEDDLRNKVSMDGEKELKLIDFQWKMVDKHFHRYKLQLRPLMMAIDFSSTASDSPWFAAVTWLKKIFGADKTLNKCPVTDSPEKTRPKRLQPYLFDINTKGEQKFHGDRYEFWIYRQMRKRLKAGELYLADSVHHRSLQQEINSANEKGALVQPLDIPALRNPIRGCSPEPTKFPAYLIFDSKKHQESICRAL